MTTPDDESPDGLDAAAGLNEHPARRQVVSEMHLRRWPSVPVPGLIIQWLRLADDEDKAAHRDILLDLPAARQWEAASGARHLAGTLSGDIDLAWECHSEATSLTVFVRPGTGELLEDLLQRADLSSAIALAEKMPGQVVRATRTWIVPDEASVERARPGRDFIQGELVSCRIGAGARIWSDFRIGPDSYGQLLVAANGVPAGDLSRLLQRLQELGNYRNMALLGLPLAQTQWPRLDKAEELLRQIGKDQLRADIRDDELLLRTSELSLDLISLATDASYRMSATSAYAKLVEDRLVELSVEPIAGYPSLVDFTQRRFSPAVRTCAAITRREGELSVRAAQLTSLLRARISTRIENQNAQLLASMERSAAMQLRLQQLVEGLSVVALSYYSLALLDKLLGGMEEVRPDIHAHLIVALLTLPVVIIVWLTLRWMKKRVMH